MVFVVVVNADEMTANSQTKNEVLNHLQRIEILRI
jgi:hypothetical protein